MVENSLGAISYASNLFSNVELSLTSFTNLPSEALCKVNLYGVVALEKVLM